MMVVVVLDIEKYSGVKGSPRETSNLWGISVVLSVSSG